MTMAATEEFDKSITASDYIKSICERCGTTWQCHNRYRWRANFDTSMCFDCKATPKKSIKTAYGICKIWQGDIDLDTMQLLQDGVPVYVYDRICGLADCVNGAHKNHYPSI